jgi:hypothetical protein
LAHDRFYTLADLGAWSPLGQGDIRFAEGAAITEHATLTLQASARDVRCAADTDRRVQEPASWVAEQRKRHQKPWRHEACDLDELVIENCILSWKINL